MVLFVECLCLSHMPNDLGISGDHDPSLKKQVLSDRTLYPIANLGIPGVHTV